MTRPGCPDPWVAPWTRGLQQARCAGVNCNPGDLPGRLVVAVTLTDGLCASCARSPLSDEQGLLRLDVSA